MNQLNQPKTKDRRRYPRITVPPLALVRPVRGFADEGQACDTPAGPDAEQAGPAGAALCARVLDFSPGGVLVECEHPPYWADGRTKLELHFEPGEETLGIFCRGRWARAPDVRDVDEAGLQFGLELEFDPDQRARVADAYHRLRFGALSRRGQLDPARLEQLFWDSSGLTLGGLPAGSPWLSAAWPNTLSHEVVYRSSGGRLLGHIAVTRAYKRAWLGHELAFVPEDPEAARCHRELYQHFCVWPRLLDGDDVHVLGYFGGQEHLHRRLLEAFALKSPPGQCVITPLDRYVPGETIAARRAAATSGAAHDSFGRSLHWGPLREQERTGAVELIRSQWSPLTCEAFDVTPESLDQEALHPVYFEEGRGRGRACVALRLDGELQGVGLCEWTDPALSGSGPLNVAHVFLTDRARDAAARDWMMRHSLCSAIQDTYLTRGLPLPSLTCAPGSFGFADLPTHMYAETMGCVVLSGRALRDFEVFVEQALAAVSSRP